MVFMKSSCECLNLARPYTYYKLGGDQSESYMESNTIYLRIKTYHLDSSIHQCREAHCQCTVIADDMKQGNS